MTQTLKEQLNSTFEGTQLEKAIALAIFLELNEDDETEIEVSEYNESLFIVDGNSEYLVLDDDERINEATDYIKNTIWAFNPTFLAGQTDWSLLPVYEALVKAGLCESSNEAVLALVEKFSTIEDFVDEATSVDGYGHFLAGYDHEENESEDGKFFIYRQN